MENQAHPYDQSYRTPELTPNVSNFERGLSIGFGVLLVYSGVKNFRRMPVRAVLRAALGSGMIIRGAAGYCPLYKSLKVDGTRASSVNIRAAFTVNKPRNEVYAAWRNLGTLPRFMKHLTNVMETGDTRSHWEARIPGGNPMKISWDAEIIRDEPGKLLSWQSLPGSTIENAGKIEFSDALGNRGTEIKVTLIYRPPAGNIGEGVARLLNPVFKRIIREDVLSFKQYIEFHNETRAAG